MVRHFSRVAVPDSLDNVGGSEEVVSLRSMSESSEDDLTKSVDSVLFESAFVRFAAPKSSLGMGSSSRMLRAENLPATSVRGLPPPIRSGSNEREGRSVLRRRGLGKKVVVESSRHSLLRLGETYRGGAAITGCCIATGGYGFFEAGGKAVERKR